jgi:hypothetical protein
MPLSRKIGQTAVSLQAVPLSRVWAGAGTVVRIADELVTSPNLRIIVSRASPATFQQSKSYILE